MVHSSAVLCLLRGCSAFAQQKELNLTRIDRRGYISATNLDRTWSDSAPPAVTPTEGENCYRIASLNSITSGVIEAQWVQLSGRSEFALPI